MPDSTLASLDFSRYFTLLRENLPQSACICVYDISGTLLSADAGSAQESNKQCQNTCVGSSMRFPQDDRSLHVGRNTACAYYSMTIFAVADDISGSLSVVMPATECLSDQHVERLLEPVITCIEKELRLTTELDAMARELAGRYEELNLVYEDSEKDVCAGADSQTFKKFVEDYVDYLGVNLVALVFPSQSRVFCATSSADPIPDPFGLVSLVADKYLPQAESGKSLLLINDMHDRAARELGIDIPCKVVATPVQNNRNEVVGLLICMNHTYKADFYNSDKNLLTVMARKVAKILHANFDSLTGFYNHSVFTSLLENALETANTQGQFHCLLDIDLGGMCVINEQFGREAGDAAIRHVARLIKSKLRITDFVAYLGDARYGLLMERCRFEQAEQVAVTLRDLVADNPIEWQGKTIDLEISLGIAQIEPSTSKIDEAIEAAEIARQSAKKLGQGQIQTYHRDDSDLVSHKQRLRWVTRIRQAIAENRFRMFCQTIAPTRPVDEAYHFEVLLRLMGPEGDVVSPAEFIPPAEQFNLMPMLDRWVIDTTFSTLSNAGYGQYAGEGVVSINLSGQSLGDLKLPDHIAVKLDEYGIDADCICFEITETVAFRDCDQAIECMHAIKSLGCHLSLDDFGTGLSSFSYLKDLPVDYLKIDGSFVRSILEDNVSHAMVASINQIGHVMGLKTIAEFVENNALSERLVEMQIDYLQGYSIAKPMPLEEYLDQLDETASAGTGKAS